jgi:hypothetical protein
MADEIRVSLKLTARKAGAVAEHSLAYNVDMAGDDMLQATQVIGTSAELVTLGEITGAPGCLMLVNLDATNFVEIGGDEGLTVFKLKILPGEAAFVTLSSATLYALADTAAVRILKIATEL